MDEYRVIREKAYESNMKLPENGLVKATFGNVSCIDRGKGVFAIKPSGVDYKSLSASDMVIVDLQCRTVDGKLNPSSDTNTHAVLYKNFPEITGIVHTHSTYATAWAQAIRPIPVYGTTHADHLAADIPCTDIMSDAAIQRDYETETGLQIIRCFQEISYREIQMVLVACHGPFTWGETPEKAVYNSIILEELAKMAFITEKVNSSVNRIKNSLIKKHYERKHGKNATYGQKK